MAQGSLETLMPVAALFERASGPRFRAYPVCTRVMHHSITAEFSETDDRLHVALAVAAGAATLMAQIPGRTLRGKVHALLAPIRS